MAKKTIDFTDVNDYEKVPEGKYVVYVNDMEETTSKNDNSMYKTKFKVAQGEQQGNTIFDNLMLTKSAAWRIRDFLTACGFDVPKKKIEVDFEQCLGKMIKITVEHQEDSDFVNVTDFEEIEDEGSVDIDSDDALDARF
jgi:hypothetical protein